MAGIRRVRAKDLRANRAPRPERPPPQGPRREWLAPLRPSEERAKSMLIWPGSLLVGLIVFELEGRMLGANTPADITGIPPIDWLPGAFARGLYTLFTTWIGFHIIFVMAVIWLIRRRAA